MKTTRIPDGKGGWQEIEVDAVHKGGTVDVEKQAQSAMQTFITEAGELTERLAKFANLHCKENGLTPEHAAFAVALLCCNVRNDFPASAGGPAKFDQMATQAQDYYDVNAPKVKKP